MFQFLRVLWQVGACILLTSSTVLSGNITVQSRPRPRTCHPPSFNALRLQFAHSNFLHLPRTQHKRRHQRDVPQDESIMLEQDDGVVTYEQDEDIMTDKFRRRMPRSTNDEDMLEVLDKLSLDMVSAEVAEQQQYQSKNSSTKDLEPWHCEMKRKWKRMKKGIYPRHIETGRCRQTQCFNDMYECRPRKQVMNILKRSRRKCVPVPNTDDIQTHYEERWRWSKVKVVIGCECRRRIMLQGL